VMKAYRRIYYGAPTSTKADPSVVAVAELMVEMGRRFDDDDVLRSAIGQYEFLRREYPGSKYRCDALVTIGQIYKDDLGDPGRARATFQEFLRRYPHNRLADDARNALAEPVEQVRAKKTIARAEDAEDDSGTDAPAQQASEKPALQAKSKLARVTGIRHWSTPDYTRVTIDLEHDVKYQSQR